MKTFVKIGETTHEVELTERLGELIVRLDGEPCEVEYAEADQLGQIILIHGGKSYAMSIEGGPHDIAITIAGHRYDCELEDERERAANLAARAANKGGGLLKAVMPGVVVELLVEPITQRHGCGRLAVDDHASPRQRHTSDRQPPDS